MENVVSTASRAAGDRKRVFVGRQEELELFREVAGDTSQLGVLLVHGPGGVSARAACSDASSRRPGAGDAPSSR
ncbi:hypothetical protein SFUMM280S_09321 [Streptomyces fumanus]